MHADAVALVLIGFDIWNRRALRDKAAATSRDHDHGRDEFGADVGLQFPATVAQLFKAGCHFAEMVLRVKRLDLFKEFVGQFLPRDDGKTRNVVDRLFRIELGALPARPIENVDQVRFQIEQAEFKDGEQPDRAGSYDDDIRLDWRAHTIFHNCLVYDLGKTRSSYVKMGRPTTLSRQGAAM